MRLVAANEQYPETKTLHDNLKNSTWDVLNPKHINTQN